MTVGRGGHDYAHSQAIPALSTFHERNVETAGMGGPRNEVRRRVVKCLIQFEVVQWPQLIKRERCLFVEWLISYRRLKWQSLQPTRMHRGVGAICCQPPHTQEKKAIVVAMWQWNIVTGLGRNTMMACQFKVEWVVNLQMLNAHSAVGRGSKTVSELLLESGVLSE